MCIDWCFPHSFIHSLLWEGWSTDDVRELLLIGRGKITELRQQGRVDQAVTLPDIYLGLRRKAQSPSWVSLGSGPPVSLGC